MFVPINTPAVNPRITQARIAHTAAIEAPNKVFRPEPSTATTSPSADGGDKSKTMPADSCFLSSEGMYTLRERIHVAIPPMHPNDIAAQPPNALEISDKPMSSGCQISLVMVGGEVDAPAGVTVSAAALADVLSDSLSLSDDGGQFDVSVDETISSSQLSQPTKSSSIAPASGSAATRTTALKRKKPRNKLTNTSSSFVSRILHHRDFAKHLGERNTNNIYVITNTMRAINWLDVSTSDAVQSDPESMSRILFTRSAPLSHDINALTRAPTHIDVVAGFASGDVFWFDPITSRYKRMNKQGAVSSTSVTHIRWMPESESLFLAAFANGMLVLFDKEKDDPSGQTSFGATAMEAARRRQPTAPGAFQVLQSYRAKQLRTNPVAMYSASPVSINDFAFDPSGTMLAVVDDRGLLQIIDWRTEAATHVFSSYYGGLTCVCWSPDGQYILTGGEDDFVSIWSVARRQLMARGAGHQSWVRDVAFDEWRCTTRRYRFGSVGDDGRLLLWDFAPGSVQKLKPSLSAVHLTGLNADGTGGAIRRTDTNSSIDTDFSGAMGSSGSVHVHHVTPRHDAVTIHPVVAKDIDGDPLENIVFRPEAIYLSSKLGHISIWNRPDR